MPKKEDAKKISKGKGTAGSRPCSPDRELVNGVGGGRPKAPLGRKRKANAMDKSGDEVKQEKNFLFRLRFFFVPFLVDILKYVLIRIPNSSQ